MSRVASTSVCGDPLLPASRAEVWPSTRCATVEQMRSTVSGLNEVMLLPCNLYLGRGASNLTMVFAGSGACEGGQPIRRTDTIRKDHWEAGVI